MIQMMIEMCRKDNDVRSTKKLVLSSCLRSPRTKLQVNNSPKHTLSAEKTHTLYFEQQNSLSSPGNQLIIRIDVKDVMRERVG